MDSPVSFEDIGNTRTQQGEDGCIPLFHNRVVEDTAKSESTGKRAFIEVAYVKVLSPGNDKEIPDFRVTSVHKERWPKQWAAFINNEEMPVDGTPLKMWSGITPVEIRTLQESKIKTVETLVNTPDINLTNIGHGFLPLKHRAEAFLKSVEGEAGFQKLSKENKDLKTQIDTLTEQVNGLEEKLSKAAQSKKSKLIKK